MKLKYLGTSAAEGIPALFCHCRVCESARHNGGKEMRTRCQSIIDDKILIDFGPDTYWHMIKYGINLASVEICLITHTHGDHLFANDILMRKGNHALYDDPIPPLKVWGGQGVYDMLSPNGQGYITKDGRVQFEMAVPFEKITFGEYTVTPLPAVHNTVMPLIYLIEKHNKALLYAHDTDIFDEKVWEYLRGKNISCVSLDCTEGIKHIDYHGHMNFERAVKVKERMIADGIAEANAYFVVSHFSHNGLVTHPEAEAEGEKQGFITAYDGMEISI